MLSVAVFATSLVGLLALFGCKALELEKRVRTPLTTLRRIGDPLLTEGWAYYSAHVRRMAFAALRVSILWLRAGILKIESTVDTAAHTLASRLNRYLRTRRLHMRRGGEVSPHLKTVLEKTEKNTEEPPSL